ncbi:MAG TPA: DUF5652 family protein [Chitinophagaceae bacterium]
MDTLRYLNETMPWLLAVAIGLAIWEIVWKIIAMWRSARNNHLAWFICIAILNTLGVLSIIYIRKHQKNKPRF